MTTDTPRTDAFMLEINEGRVYATKGLQEEFSRTLERDLADTTADMLRIHNEKVDHFEARIKAERDLSECRAALAERQAAIDELCACKDMGERAEEWDNYETYTEWCADRDAHRKREPIAWTAIRALATKDKEPQPAAKDQ